VTPTESSKTRRVFCRQEFFADALDRVSSALERRRVPLGPVVLGIILGGPLEERFIQTLTGSGGSPLAFFDRPVAALLGALCISLWAFAAGTSVLQRTSRTGGNV